MVNAACPLGFPDNYSGTLKNVPTCNYPDFTGYWFEWSIISECVHLHVRSAQGHELQPNYIDSERDFQWTWWFDRIVRDHELLPWHDLWLTYMICRVLFENAITSIESGAFTGLASLTVLLVPYLYFIYHKRRSFC